ncbi:MAG: hydrogenase maturation protease [Prochlorotrichaceae cyanobacterium]
MNSLPLRLVIGYGNTIRQDDGIGYRLAERLTDQPPTLSFCRFKAIAVHQLTPDLVAEVTEATEVIFVDMVPADQMAKLIDNAISTPSVQLQRLRPGQQSTLGHMSNPQSILQLSDRLFGKAPQGYWLLIPGEWCDLGEELSPLAQAGFTQALAIVQAPNLETFSP